MVHGPCGNDVIVGIILHDHDFLRMAPKCAQLFASLAVPNDSRSIETSRNDFVADIESR